MQIDVQNLLIATFSILAIVLLYKKIEHNRVVSFDLKVIALFSLLIILSAFLFNPYENKILWVLWVIFMYATLDDWLTGSVNVLGIWIISLILVLYDFKMVELLVAVIVTLLVFYYSKKTKGVGLADVWLMLPLIYYFELDSIYIILTALTLVSWSVFLKKKKEVALFPYIATSILLVQFSKLVILIIVAIYSCIYIYGMIKALVNR